MENEMAELRSVWEGTMSVLGVELKCHVLNDGQRVIEAKSLDRLFNAMADGDYQYEGNEAETEAFFRWMKGGN